jgi:hypothetical protein
MNLPRRIPPESGGDLWISSPLRNYCLVLACGWLIEIKRSSIRTLSFFDWNGGSKKMLMIRIRLSSILLVNSS